MKVSMHIETIDVSHLPHLFDCLKKLELKPGTFSQLQIQYEKETVTYHISHNKKSFSICSTREDTNK